MSDITDEERDLVKQLDAQCDDLKGLLPPQPYINTAPSDKPYQRRDLQRGEWRRDGIGELFQGDEERMQYQTFILHDPDKTIIRQTVPVSSPTPSAVIARAKDVQTLKTASSIGRSTTPTQKKTLKEYLAQRNDGTRKDEPSTSPAFVSSVTFDQISSKSQTPDQSPRDLSQTDKSSQPVGQREAAISHVKAITSLSQVSSKTSLNAPATPLTYDAATEASVAAKDRFLPPSLRCIGPHAGQAQKQAVYSVELDRALPSSLSLSPDLSARALSSNITTNPRPLPKPTPLKSTSPANGLVQKRPSPGEVQQALFPPRKRRRISNASPKSSAETTVKVRVPRSSPARDASESRSGSPTTSVQNDATSGPNQAAKSRTTVLIKTEPSSVGSETSAPADEPRPVEPKASDAKATKSSKKVETGHKETVKTPAKKAESGDKDSVKVAARKSEKFLAEYGRLKVAGESLYAEAAKAIKKSQKDAPSKVKEGLLRLAAVQSMEAALCFITAGAARDEVDTTTTTHYAAIVQTIITLRPAFKDVDVLDGMYALLEHVVRAKYSARLTAALERMSTAKDFTTAKKQIARQSQHSQKYAFDADEKLGGVKKKEYPKTHESLRILPRFVQLEVTEVLPAARTTLEEWCAKHGMSFKWSFDDGACRKLY